MVSDTLPTRLKGGLPLGGLRGAQPKVDKQGHLWGESTLSRLLPPAGLSSTASTLIGYILLCGHPLLGDP